MKKHLPKVKFRIIPFKEMVDLIYCFLTPSKEGWDWSNIVYWGHPKLKTRLKGVKDKKKRKEIIDKFFKDQFKKETSRIRKKIKFFQKEWEKINDQVMLVLSELVEQDWGKQTKEISARVSLNPICPRFIKERTFDVYYKDTARRMKSTAIHEILHFIYFEKWKKVFPKIKEREFDSPYLVWKLSEMVPGIVLNDKKIQKIFTYRFFSYKEFQTIQLKGRPLLSSLQKFYDERRNFEDFLRKSWAFVKKHEKEINKRK